MPGAVYRFGRFSLDPDGFGLVRGQTPVTLSPKLVDLLLYLVSRPSTRVTKAELFKAVWPDVIVSDNALAQAIPELRQALGDAPARPRSIQTVAGRGSRFIRAVDRAHRVQATVAGSAPSAARPAVRTAQGALRLHRPARQDREAGPVMPWTDAPC